MSSTNNYTVSTTGVQRQKASLWAGGAGRRIHGGGEMSWAEVWDQMDGSGEVLSSRGIGMNQVSKV